MRRTLATIATLTAALVVLSACGDGDRPSGAPGSPVASTASSEPTADTSGEVPADGGAVPEADVTLGTFRNGGDAGVPGATGIDVDFTVRNSADYAVTFHFVFAIFDASDTQVCGYQFDTAPAFGPTLAGKTVHVTGSYVADCVLPKTFTVKLTEAQRIPA